MNIERPTPAQMRDILEREYRCMFFPPKYSTIPDINTDLLATHIYPDYMQNAIEALNFFQQFLRGVPVSDSWGNDHESRRTWRAQMTLQYDEVFVGVYQRTNNFRGNRLSMVQLEIRDLGDNASDNILQQKTAVLKQHLGELTGNYHTISDPQIKLEIVRAHEDAVYEVLRSLE